MRTLLYGIFKTGIEGDIVEIENLRNAPGCLPDNILRRIGHFMKAEWTTKLMGEDVKRRGRWGPRSRCRRYSTTTLPLTVPKTAPGGNTFRMNGLPGFGF
jgi:hypothetical protein